MQAPPSFTAFAEHLVTGLPSPPTAALPHTPSSVFAKPTNAAGFALDVADGIGLAHDAGNLLGAIRLYCDLLALPGVLRSEHRHYAEELHRLTARSGSLIDRLLRPGVAAMVGTPVTTPFGAAFGAANRLAERVCLADAVLACRGMLDPVAGVGSLLIAVEAGARCKIAVPHEALERILLNLIKNAAEARRTGGADVTAGTDGPGGMDEAHGMIAVRVRSVVAWGADGVDAVALSVEDRGRGMNEAALQAALTGKTDEARSANPERPGRGIGLRVVRELTARTGGELRMRSRAGQGTTVEIVWPVASDEDGAGSG